VGTKNIYERFVWFDNQVKARKYPNATSLSEQFEISTKTAQRDIDFLRDRLLCPLHYDSSQKGYYYSDDTFSLPMVYLSSGDFPLFSLQEKCFRTLVADILERRSPPSWIKLRTFSASICLREIVLMIPFPFSLSSILLSQTRYLKSFWKGA